MGRLEILFGQRPDLTAAATAALRAGGITAPESYFYHGDHISNTTYMTNRAGAVTQHTEYLPFGEPLSVTYRGC